MLITNKQEQGYAKISINLKFIIKYLIISYSFFGLNE
jgi:hypothetical protein